MYKNTIMLQLPWKRATSKPSTFHDGRFIPSTAIFLHVFVDLLQGLGSEAHVLQDLRVGVRVLQSFPLKLDGGERAIDLGELLLQALLPLQGLQGS